MTYVVSDMHGEHEKFTKMLEKIGFGDSDVMYVLGNSLDYCDKSVTLISDLSMRYNAISIVGEHEFRALKLLTKIDKILKNNTSPGVDDKTEIAEMMENGGAKTIKDFSALDADMREGILEYLADLSLYEEVRAGGKNYLLVSSGIAGFDPATPLEDYMPEDFIYEPLDPAKSYFKDKIVVAGHTRTSSLSMDGTDRIVYGNGSIFINCGAAFGGKLACLCLENGKEFYI